jgi:hypothetical protein
LSDLAYLLQRVRKIQEPTDDPVQASAPLKMLLLRMDTRQWRNYVELEIIELLRDMEFDLAIIKHAKKCKWCLLELCLDVERYRGSRSGLWYLDMLNDWEYFMEIYPDAPDPRKYKFGSYWTRDEGQAIPFIKDRMQWAKGVIKKQLVIVDQLFVLVQNWDSSDIMREQFLNLCTQLNVFVATPPNSDDYA